MVVKYIWTVMSGLTIADADVKDRLAATVVDALLQPLAQQLVLLLGWTDQHRFAANAAVVDGCCR